jgi:hypothetical protein
MEPDSLMIDKDLTVIGPITTREDVHQGRFSCPIFTEKRMNFSGLDFEINAVIRKDTRESLGDALHGDQGLGHKSSWKGFFLSVPGRRMTGSGSRARGKTGAGRARFLVPSSATQ